MKDLLLSVATALLVFAFSCTKTQPDEPVIPVPVDTPIIALGKVSVLKNGVLWNATFYAKYYPNDLGTFLISGKGLNNSLEEELGFRDIPAKGGYYLMERSSPWNGHNNIPQALFSVVLDFDQLLNGYNVDSTRADQFIEILRYDSVNHIVEGRFQTFLEGPTNISFLPDSIALTEGKFHLKIQEQ